MKSENRNQFIVKAEQEDSLGNKQEAIVNYLRAMEFEPENLMIWFKLGLLYHEINQLDKAFECYSKVLDNSPDFVDAIVSIANIYLAKKEIDKAISLYEKAIILNPYFYQAAYVLGSIYYDKGDFDNAERCYKHSLMIEPDNIFVARNLAGLYIATQKFDKALDILDPFSEDYEEYATITYNLGMYFFENENYEKALDVFKKSYKSDSEHKSTDILLNMAKCYEEIGNLSQSAMSYRKALKVFPNSSDIHYNLGRIYHLQNLEELAIQELNNAIKYDSQNELAINLLNIINERSQN